MSDMSDYLANKLLDHSLGTAAYTMPTVYLALYTVTPTASTDGTEVSSGLGYTRQAITLSAAASRITANTNSISFGPNTTTNWGTVVGAAVVDAASGACNVLYFKSLANARTVVIGDRIEFDPGDVDFEL